jgi:hypothetical protein
MCIVTQVYDGIQIQEGIAAHSGYRCRFITKKDK